jgi:hypothetical protein
VTGKAKGLFLIVAVLAAIGIMLYLYRSSTPGLEVEPHAKQEIEKAKRR